MDGQDRPRQAYRHRRRCTCCRVSPAPDASCPRLPVPDRTTEVTAPPALPAPFDLTHYTVAADALHTTREQTCYLVEVKKARFVPVVKRSQPRLHTEVRYDRERHGRRGTSAVRALTVTGLGLAHSVSGDSPALSGASRPCTT
ncbi:hypothetical protein [Streptomyces sp. AK02-04a]|uniref:hypothetical protein n=1 Tax=Streptomyces sp. AK02-04a TaxID=3028649 RepID=UPI00299FE3F8|nr:hypothetical protein [Streptomyces sp. AK02-04a]MDX3764024.1 hypothetical protein [Streptomyces sp. AK02-04a]